MLQQELMDEREHLCLDLLAHQDVKVTCREAAVQEWSQSTLLKHQPTNQLTNQRQD
jgi:hypothetical protein